MCDINDVNKNLTDFKKVTEARHVQLEKMITEVHNKNIEEHQQIRQSQEKLSNTVNKLATSIVDYKVETSKSLGEITGKLGVTTGKADTAVAQSKTEQRINSILKWAIGVAVIIGLSMLGVMTNNSINSRKQLKEEAIQNKIDFAEKTAAYKAMIQMNAKFESFSGKALFDTINTHWQIEKDFYTKEFKPQAQWTHTKYVEEIHPNTIRSKKNNLILKNHEKRITKLEHKESI